MAHDRVRDARRQVEERAGRQIERVPAGLAAPAPVEVERRARRDGRTERHRSTALELHPERIHVAVVVQTHALTAAALHQKKKRRFVAPGTEQLLAQGDHQPGDARQHLVRLWEEDGGPARERSRQSPRVARAIVAALEGDLERHATARERDRRGEGRHERTPRAVMRRHEGHAAA